MKIFAGLIIAGGVLSIAAIQAASYVKQPLNTLSYIYGHTEEISNGVADGSFKGINTTQQQVASDINKLPEEQTQSSLASLQSVYASLDQIESN